MNIVSIDAVKYYIKKSNLKLENKLVKMTDEKKFFTPLEISKIKTFIVNKIAQYILV